MLRVGTRVYSGAKYTDPEYPGFTPIICLTKSTAYGSLGPYVLKTKEGYIMENIYQGSKIYETIPANVQRYSRYDSTIIWDHPAETHLKDGVPTPEMLAWRMKVFTNEYPLRYPVGMKWRSECVGSITQEDLDTYLEGKGEFKLLSYIEARKVIYWREYRDAVVKEKQFLQLRQRLAKGENLLIIEVDGPHQESLSYYMKTYGVNKDFIVNRTMLATEYNLKLMIDDSRHAFGHCFCLAAALQGIDMETPMPPLPIKKKKIVVNKYSDEEDEEDQDEEEKKN